MKVVGYESDTFMQVIFIFIIYTFFPNVHLLMMFIYSFRANFIHFYPYFICSIFVFVCLNVFVSSIHV